MLLALPIRRTRPCSGHRRFDNYNNGSDCIPGCWSVAQSVWLGSHGISCIGACDDYCGVGCVASDLAPHLEEYFFGEKRVLVFELDVGYGEENP